MALEILLKNVSSFIIILNFLCVNGLTKNPAREENLNEAIV